MLTGCWVRRVLGAQTSTKHPARSTCTEHRALSTQHPAPRGRRAFVAALCVAFACAGPPTPEIFLVGSPDPTAVEVRGLPAGDVRALAAAGLGQEQWSSWT